MYQKPFLEYNSPYDDKIYVGICVEIILETILGQLISNIILNIKTTWRIVSNSQPSLASV